MANQENKTPNKVTLQLWGEGIRIDVLDCDEAVVDCYNAITSDIFEVKVINDTKIEKEISKADLGEGLGYTDEDDPDYTKVSNWDEECNLSEPEENEWIESINLIQTKIYGEALIELTEDEVFDPKKVRLLWKEFILPDEEVPVYFGVLYNGKEYPITLDIDSEREIATETIWEL